MKICVVASHPIQYYSPLFGELSKYFDVCVMYAHRATPEEQAMAGFGVPFEWDIDLLSGHRYQFLENVSKAPGSNQFWGCDTPGVGAALEEEKPDVVLLMGWHLKSFHQCLIAAKRMGVPVLVRGDSQLGTARSITKRLVKRLVYPYFLRLFDGALYTGGKSREYFEHYGMPAKKLFFSPHCVDVEFFRSRSGKDVRRRIRERLGIQKDVKVLLFAGKLVPFKCPLDVVRAAAMLRTRRWDVEVLIAGSGPLEADLISEAAALDVTVHLMGFQNQSEMPGAYAAADVLVLPSNSRETWGLVANEAVACGVPVVLSDECGCVSDLLSSERAGLSYRHGDIASMSTQIERLLGSPPLAEEMMAVSAAYSLEAAAKGIERAAITALRRK